MKKLIISLFVAIFMVAILPVSLITAFADDDPAFITEPTGGYVAEGEKYTISWETNFDPVWMQILVFNSIFTLTRFSQILFVILSFENF